MIGDGPALPLIRKYVVEHNVQNLQLDGWIQDARQIYRDAQILCSTSTTEGLPLVLLESMASGVPVVASNVGGIPELIKDASVGSLVTTFTEVDFLNAIVSLCQDAERYSAVSRNARNWVKEGFSLNRMLDQLAGLYEELLKTRSGSGNEMIFNIGGGIDSDILSRAKNMKGQSTSCFTQRRPRTIKICVELTRE
jgi:glycosyltransferase involved in cell wall biosynthesis